MVFDIRMRICLTIVSCLALLCGCGSLPPVGDPTNALPQATTPRDKIRWPAGYRPEEASFFVHNEVHVRAPPELVWEVLVHAEAWPTWYEGASDVKLPSAARGVLTEGTSFTWTTMGLDFTSTVKELAPPYRLSWESRKSTIKGYHAWLVVPTRDGCDVITEESQHGFLTLMQKVFVPTKLHRLHDVWLAGIKKKAEAKALTTPVPGSPPVARVAVQR